MSDKDKGVNGAVVKSICSKKAISLDGRIQVGDYIVRINQENLRNVTSSQARAILRRTNLIGTQCKLVDFKPFIPSHLSHPYYYF
ncbi:hypothetical protein COOONC_20137 [Cooperia oncophora]